MEPDEGDYQVSAPEIGKPAPQFTLPAHPDGTIALKQFKGDCHVVLYFYPKDSTSGCTKEAVGFQEHLGALRDAGAVVLGVSPDSLESHAKFAEKYGLTFPLLSDPDAKVATKYGVWKEKSMYGRTYMGIERTNFIIDRAGKVRHIFPKVKVPGHAEAVLAAVRELEA